jgi:hypothetical protein
VDLPLSRLLILVVPVVHVQAQILPLRKTISRLTRENNELHVRMIDQAEEVDGREGRFKREVASLRNQLENLNYLSTQKDVKLTEQGSVACNERTPVSYTV